MSKTQLIQSRNKAFKNQHGLCFYCELPMWKDDSELFSKQFNITKKQALMFQCTAEHLLAKQDGGKDHQPNIVAACKYCNHKRHARKKPKDPVTYKSYVTNRLKHGGWNAPAISKSYIFTQTYYLVTT
jgi:5-methylcytosine-specific restriction endonuclease McrA